MNDKRAYILSLGMFLTLACTIVLGTPVPTPTSDATPIPPSPTAPPPVFIETTPPPMAYIISEADCRTGPGAEYDLVGNLSIGQELTLTGRGGSYWIVQLPDAGECWVDASAVTVEGDAATLAERVPPPAPTPSAPAAPTGLAMTRRSCTRVMVGGVPKYEIEFTITWQDMSNNEDGFYLYRDNNRVGELPPNATQMSDTYIVRTGGKTIVYYVVAYNSLGQSQSEILSLANPCFN